MACGKLDVLCLERQLRESLDVIAADQLEYGLLLQSQLVQRVQAFGVLGSEAGIQTRLRLRLSVQILRKRGVRSDLASVLEEELRLFQRGFVELPAAGDFVRAWSTGDYLS